MSEKPNPNRKVTVKHGIVDADVSQDAITTRVELRENAINMVTLTANNEDGANYLSTLHLNDEVKVKMISDSNPPTPIDWNNDPLVRTVFRGNIQELSPILNKAGQICQVVAFGKGYQLKEMKVNKKYGAIVPLPALGNTYSFDDEIKEWSSVGTNPWIKNFPPITLFMIGVNLDNIYVYLNGSLGQEIGAFTFMIDPEYDGAEFEKIELHIIAAKLGDATSVSIRPYYSIDGVTWHTFTGDLQFTNIETGLPALPELGGWNDSQGFNPMIHDITPKGDERYIDIIEDIPFWNKNLRIKLEISGASGTYDNTEVSIKYMWLEYTFKANQGKTVRQILAGDEYTIGIIENFVNKILGTDMPSGYDNINTDYVFGYTEIEDDYKIPYIQFPYQDALISIQDIIKYASSLKFLKNNSGYHWIVDEDNNLIVAPVNNHDVYGIDNEHLISDKWKLRPYATPIKVKQDMVTQAFKQEIPLANYVLVAGKYKYPLNDEICKGLGINLWQTSGGIGLGERKIYLDTYDVGANGACLHMEGCYNPIAAVNNVYAYPLPADLDFTKLMGKEAIPSVFFIFKTGGLTADYEFRLYFEDPDNLGHPDTVNYFRYAFTGMQTDTWVATEIELPNTEWYKNFKGWELVSEDGTKDWKDIKDVKFFAFRFNSSVTAIGVTYCKVFGLSFNGTVIYGLYDSTSIKPVAEGGLGFGCRMITIKDTYALTDTLDIDDIASTPLGLECLYELKRYSKLRTTGEIAIPLDPIWIQGQQVWLQTEQDINGEYKIDDWFRITKVTHEFNIAGALTKLQVTDDLESSIPIDTVDPYTVTMRTINIDFQTRTMGSLKSYADFTQGLNPIIQDHPS